MRRSGARAARPPARRRLACVVVLVVLFVAPVVGAQESTFRYGRPVTPGQRGPNRLDPDAALLAGVAHDDLRDLRLFDPGGREVSYLLIQPPAVQSPWSHEARILPIPATKISSGFEADLGRLNRIDRMRIEGLGAPILKRFRLEGSGDRARWTVLVPDGTLFDLPEEKLTRLDVDLSAGEYRYLRVTWNDRESARVPLPQRVSVRLVGAESVGAPLEVPVRVERRASEPRKSRFHLQLPGPRLPVVALRLGVGSGHLLRDAVVTEGRLEGSEVKPHVLGRATLRRAERSGAVAEEMRIPITRPAGPDLELEVEDGDNPPIALLSVHAEIAPQPWIYLESADGSPLTARYGNPTLTAPRYDVESMRRYLNEVKVQRASWGTPRESAPPRSAPAQEEVPLRGAEIDPDAYQFARPIPVREPGLTSLLVDEGVLAHARQDLGDLRVVDESNHQIPYLLERRPEPLRLDLPYPRRLEASGSISRYEIRLPYESLPGSARLVLGTESRVFERTVSVVQPAPRGTRDEERLLASTVWRHADPKTEPPDLVVEIPVTGVEAVELRIDEGDNAPISLRPAALLLPAYRLRFFYPEGAELKLLYGNPKAAPPKYDLELLSSRLFGMSAQETSAESEEARPVRSETGQRILFWIVLIMAALVLMALLARLLRKPQAA